MLPCYFLWGLLHCTLTAVSCPSPPNSLLSCTHDAELSLGISYPELEDKMCVYTSSAFSFSYWLIDWWPYFGEWPGGNKWTFRKYMTWNPENQIIFSWKIQDMWYLQNQICSFLWDLTKDSKFFQHMLRMGLKVGVAICGYLQKSLL